MTHSKLYWRLLCAWFRFKSQAALFWAFRICLARRFLKLAWLALRYKIILIDMRTTESNGGYKYHVMLISKRPVSASHDYTNFPYKG